MYEDSFHAPDSDSVHDEAKVVTSFATPSNHGIFDLIETYYSTLENLYFYFTS